MIEINFDNPLVRVVRPCRRIVSDGTPILDKSWRDKITDEQIWGDSGSYVISRRRAQVPKGMKVEFEIAPGSDMSDWVYTVLGRRIIAENTYVPVHVCTREMARSLGQDRGWDDVVEGGKAKGMKYIYVNKKDLPQVRAQIEKFIDSSENKHE